MVKGDIHIHTADMLSSVLGQKQSGHPAADKGNPLPVLAEKVNEFQENGMSGLHHPLVVIEFCYHAFLMTSFKIDSAASSPRPV